MAQLLSGRISGLRGGGHLVKLKRSGCWGFKIYQGKGWDICCRVGWGSLWQA